MIFNRHIVVVLVAGAFMVLAGCPGQDENETTPGLVVHVAEVHVEEPLATTNKITTQSLAPKVTPRLAAPVTGGYDHEHLEYHNIIDNNKHLLSVYRAYLVLDDFKLVPCVSISRLPRYLLNGIISSAYAHAGHGAEPVSGRSLDKPNVIDIVTRDEYYLPLGDLAIAPGAYCGMRLSFSQVEGKVYGKPAASPASSDDPIAIPEVPELTGRKFVMRADYCSTVDASGICVGRSKVDVDDSGLHMPQTLTIQFDKPLTVNATVNSAYIAVGIAYGKWLHDVDVSILASDDNERQKLLNNIGQSIHVYAAGPGDLPNNVD